MRHLVSKKHKLLNKIVPKEMLETLKQMKADYDDKKKESEIHWEQGNITGFIPVFAILHLSF